MRLHLTHCFFYCPSKSSPDSIATMTEHTHTHDQSHEGFHEHADEHTHDYHQEHGAFHHHLSHHLSQEKVLLIPLALTLAFSFVEAVGGWLAGSLALLSDAGHMFFDAAGFAIAWLGAKVAARTITHQYSFGYIRAEVLAALVNGFFMLLLVGMIVLEAFHRFSAPNDVKGLSVILIALLGLGVNLIVAKQLHPHQHNINTRAAMIHVMGDLLGSVVAILAGVVIWLTGWTPIDPILSLLIAGLILFSTFKLIKESTHILMEGVPNQLDIVAVESAMLNMPHVTDIHCLHVWSLSSEVVSLTAHVSLNAHANHWQESMHEMRDMLKSRFNIQHVTLEPLAADETQPH